MAWTFTALWDELQKALAALEKGSRGTAVQTALPDMASSLRTRILWGFRTRTDPWGHPWKPLTSRDGEPLQDTGALRSSIQQPGGVESEGLDTIVMTARKTGTWKGEEANIAAVHQYGATIHPRPDNLMGLLLWTDKNGKHAATQVIIPARPFLPTPEQGGMPDSWMDELQAIIADHLNLNLQGGTV